MATAFDRAIAEPRLGAAAWVEDTHNLWPLGADFVYSDIDHVPGRGTFVLATTLLLEVRDAAPQVITGLDTPLPRFEGSAGAMATPDGDRLYVLYSTVSRAWHRRDGTATASAFLLERNNGRWGELALPPVPLPVGQWWLSKLVAAPDGSVYVTAFNSGLWSTDPRTTRVGELPWTTLLYRYDGTRWHGISSPFLSPLHRIMGVCTAPGGDVFVSGRVYTTNADATVASARGFAGRYVVDEGRWRDLSPPRPHPATTNWSIEKLTCGRDGRVLAAMNYRLGETRPQFAFFVEHPALSILDGDTWQHIEDLPPRPPTDLPADRQYSQIAALAFDDRGRAWISYATESQQTGHLWRRDGQAWRQFEPPAIPRARYYTVDDIVFDENGEGWGISNVYGGAADPRSHGVLLRFRDESWKLQNWKRLVPPRRRSGLVGRIR